MPVARTALGCLGGVVALVALMLLVRPAIFSLAPPRGDDAVVVGTLAQVATPRVVPIVLGRSYGHRGEVPLPSEGRVQLEVAVSRAGVGQVSVVNTANPVDPGCEVNLAGDRLVDCAGRAWGLDGAPAEPGQPPLERFPVAQRDEIVVADFTRRLPEG